MMNCNDVTRCLDEREMAELSALESAELAAHARECESCSEQLGIGRQLSSFRSSVPPLPVSLRERSRQIEEAREPDDERLPLRRPFIIASLFVFGATTAMLATVPLGGESASLAE